MEDYIKRILKVLIYIEEHLDTDLTLDELAKISCYSSFHFHRIFQAIVGETVHNYVKRLRLERAAKRLCQTQQPITQIALDCSYETPSAFTRAFKQYMGEPPRNYRSLYKEIQSMTKKFDELPMIYPDSIEKTSELQLLFIRRTGAYETSSENAWEAMKAFIKKHQLADATLRYFSISRDNPQVTSEDKLRFDACIATQKNIQPQGEVGSQTLKGGKYAIFTLNGPISDWHSIFCRIFLKWLPSSKETLDENRVYFCEHFNVECEDTAPAKLITKICIPIA